MGRKAKLLIAIVIVCGAILYFGLRPAAAIDIAWYEQEEPGRADGVIRLGGLVDGELEIATPGRRMEFGIRRTGDLAIVRLTEPPGRSTRDGDVQQELVVVARQGAATTRAIYQLVIPARSKPNSPAAATRSAPGPARPEVPVVEQPKSGAEAVPQSTPEPASSKKAPAHRVPVVASLDLGYSKPAQPSVCPVLAICPGSLRANISRLLGECGARMGDWVTGGAGGEYLTDWVVREPRILAERNRDGLQGLLELLYAHYRLQGLPSAETAAIDIYKTE